MTITVNVPIQALDITQAGKRPDRHLWLTIPPSEYELVAMPNPFVPGIPFYIFPEKQAGGVKHFWHRLARQGRITINTVEDIEVIVTQDSLGKTLSELLDPACTDERKRELFDKLFPNISPKSAILPHPEFTKNLAAAIMYHYMFNGGSPEQINGLLPFLVAALCERNSELPFAIIPPVAVK